MGTRGILQSELNRVRCEWGKEAHDHNVVHPVFGRNYRVRGVLAFTPLAEPLWYGEAPVFAEPGLVRFKAAFQEGGAQRLGETEPDAFTQSYLCDPWGMMAELLGVFAASARREAPRNVHGQLLRGVTIVDVEFEPALHAVRAVIVQRGMFRRETLAVLGIPALAESMTSPPEPSGYAFHWPGLKKR